MTYFQKILLSYLHSGKIKMELTGFDMEGFQKTVEEKGKRLLELVADIVYQEEDLMPDAEKVAALRALLDREWFAGD